jgi:hypothetical protein
MGSHESLHPPGSNGGTRRNAGWRPSDTLRLARPLIVHVSPRKTHPGRNHRSASMGLRATELEVRSAKRSPHSTRAQTAHRSSLLSLASGSDSLIPRGKALGGLARRAVFLPDEPPTCLVCSAGVPHTVRPLPWVRAQRRTSRSDQRSPRAHEPTGAGNSGRRLSRSARCFVTSSISAMSTRRRMVGFFLLTTNGSLEQSDDNLSAALSRLGPPSD